MLVNTAHIGIQAQNNYSICGDHGLTLTSMMEEFLPFDIFQIVLDFTFKKVQENTYFSEC